MSQTPAVYSFLPWLRRGLSTAIVREDRTGTNNNPQRAEIDINLSVTADSNLKGIVTKVSLYSAADITGIDPSVIIKTEPVNNAVDFEPNYLVHIEFAEPDFPWRHIPAAAKSDGTLRPWLFLIVLLDDGTEYKDNKVYVDPNNPLPWIEVTDASKLPNPEQLWAWAHVQVLNKIEGPIQDALLQEPRRFVSRIICPRRLKPKQSYRAFLVPALETGRQAGLGEPVTESDGLKSAWPASGSVKLPVYYSFRFSTGVGGDFESLVNQLEPREMPETVGIRDMDVSNPGYGLPSPIASGVFGLEGALKAPSTHPKPAGWTGPAANNFKEKLEKILNSPADAIDGTATTSSGKPTVSAPIYGSWHAAVKRVDSKSPKRWINKLNLDPRNRATAGLGVKVIRDKQDKLMASAWMQVSEVIERINQKIREGQLAIEVSKKHYEKLKDLSKDTLVAITSPVHAKIMGSPITIRQHLKESPIPDAALSPALRRITRPRGPVRLRQLSESGVKQLPNDMLSRINRGEITAAPKRVQSDNIPEINTTSDRAYPRWIPRWMRSWLHFVPWILIAIGAFLLILFSALAGAVLLPLFIPILIGISIVIISIGLALLKRSKLWRTATKMRLEKLTPEIIKSAPPRERFVLKTRWSGPGPEPSTGTTTPVVLGQDSPEAKEFRQAAAQLQERLLIGKGVHITNQPIDIGQIHDAIITAINPSVTITASFKNRIKVNGELIDWSPDEPIDEIMAAPTFPEPMYKALRDISQDYLLPGLDKIANNTISLLLSNQEFIESFMVGLNHEMSRELLWREYPTDMRGSYFRQFWDVQGSISAGQTKVPEEMKDIEEIHTWRKNSELGQHSPRKSSGTQGHLVLLVRGDLLRRYPNSVIYAVKAEKNEDVNTKNDYPRKPVTLAEGDNRRNPIFRGTLHPDVTFLGFDLSEDKARGSGTPGDEGWFFIIQEQPSEPRFGLDVEDFSKPKPIDNWNALSWSSIADGNSVAERKADLDKLVNIDIANNKPVVAGTGITKGRWGSNSSDMAYILLQVPMRIAIHAADMLPRRGGN